MSLFAPASKLPVWLLMMSTSADCVTEATSVDVLLARCGSSVLLLTEPVLEIDVPPPTLTECDRDPEIRLALPCGECARLCACQGLGSATQVQPAPALET